MTAELQQSSTTIESDQDNLHLEVVADNLAKAARVAERHMDFQLNRFFLKLLALTLLFMAGCTAPITDTTSPTQAPVVEATQTPFAREGKKLSSEELVIWNNFAEDYLKRENQSWKFRSITGFAMLLESHVDEICKGGTFYPGFDDLVQYGNRPYDSSGSITKHAQLYYDLYLQLLSVLNLTEQQMLDIRNSSGLNGLREVIKQTLAEQQQYSEEEIDDIATRYTYNIAFSFASQDDPERSRQYIADILAQLQ